MAEKNPIVELKPNIYQIRAEKMGCHAYLVKGTSKNLLIDTGTHSNYQNLVERLAEVGLRPHDVHMIVLTHEHFDHIGASSHFIDTAVIAAHRLAANKIHLGDEFVMMGKYLDQHARNFSVDLWLQEDSVLDLGNYRFRVIHTPGHCSGAICLHEPDCGILFTGDTVLAKGRLSGIYGSGSVSDYVDSLQKLSMLRVEEFYPGHGRVSRAAEEDLRTSMESAKKLMSECRMLFETLDSKASFMQFFGMARKTPIPKEN